MPSFDRLMEAAVKAMKFYLKRIVGNQMYTYEKYTTFFAQTEAYLHFRLLISLSTDPNDLTVIF